jgi:tRNA G10  N-methylase Trm11
MIKHDHENESFQKISSKKQIWIAFFRSHLTFRDTTQNTLSAYFRSNSSQYSLQQANLHQRELTSLYSSQQWLVHRMSSSRAKKRKIAASKKLIIVMFSKKREIKIFKTKRLFSFIIACYSRSLNTIQSFRKVKRRDRLTLKDFHHTFQNVIAARQKDFELDSDYNSLSFKLSSSIISNQFFRKSILDSLNDIDLFDLKVRSSSSLKSFNRSFDRHVSLE